MPPEALKLLLVEHDPGFARYVGEMLGQARDLSAQVRLAADLGAGLSELQVRTFEAVLLDICVPDDDNRPGVDEGAVGGNRRRSRGDSASIQ